MRFQILFAVAATALAGCAGIPFLDEGTDSPTTTTASVANSAEPQRYEIKDADRGMVRRVRVLLNGRTVDTLVPVVRNLRRDTSAPARCNVLSCIYRRTAARDQDGERFPRIRTRLRTARGTTRPRTSDNDEHGEAILRRLKALMLTVVPDTRSNRQVSRLAPTSTSRPTAPPHPSRQPSPRSTCEAPKRLACR